MKTIRARVWRNKHRAPVIRHRGRHLVAVKSRHSLVTARGQGEKAVCRWLCSEC